MKKLISFSIFILSMSSVAWASIMVSGMVTDSDDEPLIGVNIIDKGTTDGTVTDLDGKYSIRVLEGATLIFSYVGYETQELIAKRELNVVMSEAGIMEEILVTGYHVKRRSRAPKKMTPTFNSQGYVNHTFQHLQNKKPLHHSNHNAAAYDEIVENEFKNVLKDPLSTFSIDVDRAAYSNIRSYIENGFLPPADAVRIEEMINYFDYDHPQPQGENPINIITELAPCPWKPEHELMMVALQGKEFPYEELPPSNLVFLIDVSGSMFGDNKLGLIKQSFRFLVDQLRSEDKISIVVYAGSSGVVLPPTSGDEKIKIMRAINNLSAGGSTAGAKGIQLAYKQADLHFLKGGNNRVILATDGDFNVGISNDNELVNLIEQKRLSGVFLTVLGFGTGNYMENKMQKLAQAGNGNHMYIDNIKEAEKVFSKEFGATAFTIAKDVKLQIEFNPKNIVAYRLIGYVNRLLEDQDFKDDKKDAGEMGSGHTVTAIYEVIRKGAKSKYLPGDIPLKYQKTEPNQTTLLDEEVATVKIRYKKPDEDISKELIHIALRKYNTVTSIDLQWAAIVAEYGMYLSESQYLPGNYNLKNLAHRAEMIRDLYEKPTHEQKELIALIKESGKLKAISMADQ